MRNTSSLSSFRPILSTASAPVALELPTDIANELVHAVCRTDNVAAVTSLSMVNRQFRSCARPAMQLLGMRDSKMMESDRKVWRGLYRTTEPVYRSLLIRATARETVRMLAPGGKASSHPLFSLLSFIAAPSGKEWWSKSDEAAVTATRVFDEGFLGEILWKTFKYAGESAQLDALATLAQGKFARAIESAGDLSYSSKKALFMAAAELSSRCDNAFAIRHALKMQLQQLEPDDQVKLAQRLIASPIRADAASWRAVLRPLESAMNNRTLFVPGRFDGPGRTFWKMMEIYSLVSGQDACDQVRTQLFGSYWDGGWSWQLCMHPYIGIDQIRLPRTPEEAPWPLILLSWVCQWRRAAPKETAKLLGHFKQMIKLGEYRFITPKEFGKLTKPLDMDPGVRLQAWMAWRCKTAQAKPGFWSRAKH